MQFNSHSKKLYSYHVAGRIHFFMWISIGPSLVSISRLLKRNADWSSYLLILAIYFLTLSFLAVLTALWYWKWPPRGGSITLEEDAISIIDQQKPVYINFSDISSVVVKRYRLWPANYVKVKRTDMRWPFNTYRINDYYEIDSHKLADQISVQVKSNFE